jgi:hypothetical protein
MNKILKTVISFAAGLAVGVGATCGIYAGINSCNSNKSDTTVSASVADISLSDAVPMSTSVAYDENTVDSGIGVDSSMYLITATIKPAEAVYKSCSWSCEFVNPDSTWATGKTASDYLLVEGGGLNCRISCNTPFGEQINLIFTVENYDGTTVTAVSTVDYAKRISDASFNFSGAYACPTTGDAGEYYNLAFSNVRSDTLCYKDYVAALTDEQKASATTSSGGNYLITMGISPSYLYTTAGTVSDTLTTSSYGTTMTYNLTLTDAAIAKLKSVFGDYFDNNYPYDVSSGCIEMTQVIEKVFYNYDVKQGRSDDFYYQVYTAFNDLYTANTEAFTLTVTGTGSVTQLLYTFTYNVLFNPDGMWDGNATSASVSSASYVM